MRYRRYTKESTPVSEIGLGTWQLGNNSGWKTMSEKEAISIVKRSLDYGINFFDTAPNYGLGTSEVRLGKALRETDRSKIVINTKFGHSDSGELDFQSDQIRKSVEGSLRRLRMNYIDSVVLHNPPREYLDGNKTDHYTILEKLREEGKIKAYGASVDTFDDMLLLMQTTNAKVVEALFNILHQDASRAFDHAMDKEVGIIVKIPLDSGWLSGKYNAQSTFDDIRSRWSRKDIQTRARLVDRVRKILKAEDGMAQKAIAFCLAYDAVSTVIPGNVSIAQLEHNVESLQQSISRALIEELEVFHREEVAPCKLPW